MNPDVLSIVTKFRTDFPNGAIDWQSLFNFVATAQSFAAMRDPIYASGTLRTGYLDRVEDDVEILNAVEHADLNRLRDLLTWVVRRDRFSPGVGDEAYWCGHLDAIFDGMGSHVGAVYPVPHTDPSRPRRIPPCPACGDTRTVDFESSSPALLWRCATCRTTFDHPGAGAVDGRVPHT